MTKNIDSRKRRMIEYITSLSSEKELESLEKFFSFFFRDKMELSVFKTPRKSISLEDLKKAQNYQKIDRSSFNQLVKKLNIEESIEDLLSMTD